MLKYITASEVEAFLTGSGNQYLSPEDRIALDNKELRLVETSLKIRKKMSGLGGLQYLLTTETGKTVGISDFDKKKIENPFVAVAVGVAGNITLQSASPTVDGVKYAKSAGNFDDACLSAKLEFRQDSQVKIRKNIASLVSDAAPEAVQGLVAMPLSLPQVLNNKGNIDITIQFPEDITVAAGGVGNSETFVEVEIVGYELIRKQ